VSRYQKGKTNLDFTEARDSEWQRHQLGHMQICTSLQTNNHASTPPLSFLQAGCPSCRPTVSKHCTQTKHSNFALAPISTLARQKCDISTNDCTILLKLVVALDSKQKPTKILPWINKVRACQKGHPARYKIQWPSASDCSVDGCIYLDSCCDIQPWAWAAHLYCSA